MEYQRNIYTLKPNNGAVTLDISVPFEHNHSEDVTRVLIYAPTDADSKTINSLISKLPLDETFKVVVDMNKDPQLGPHSKYGPDVVINAHRSLVDIFNKRVASFSDHYIGPEEVHERSYANILEAIKGRPTRRSLDSQVLAEEVV